MCRSAAAARQRQGDALHEGLAFVEFLVGGDVTGDHVVQAPGLSRVLHDPAHLLFPLSRVVLEVAQMLDGLTQPPPQAAGVVVAEQHAVAAVDRGAPGAKAELADLVAVAARVPIGGGGAVDVADDVDLPEGFVERGPEDVGRGGVSEHAQILVEPAVGDAAAGGAGDPPHDLGVGVVAADGIGDDGDLHVRMLVDESAGDLLKKLDALLHGVEAGRPIEQQGSGVDVQTHLVLELQQIEPFGREDVVERAESLGQPGRIGIGVLRLSLREHVRRDAVRDDARAAIAKLDLGLFTHAPRDDRPVEEVVLHHLLEELLADVADLRGVLDGGGVRVHTPFLLVDGNIEGVPELLQVHAVEHFERDVSRMRVVDRVEDGDPAKGGIGHRHAAGHPVVRMQDGAAFVLAANLLDVRINDLPLELRRIGQRPSVVRAAVAFEDRRADEVDVFRIELVAFLNPLRLAQSRLFAEPPRQVHRDQVDGDPPLGQSLAQRRDHLAQPAALA